MIASQMDLQPNSFTAIFAKYQRLMQEESQAIHLSDEMRMFVAGFPTEPKKHHYTNHTMQDAFFFLNDMMGKWPQQLRNLFKVLQSYSNICSECKTKSITRNRKSTVITIHLTNNNGATDFMDLFSTTAKLNCDACQKETLHTCSDFWSFPYESQFVVLYIHNFNNQQQRIKSYLTGYTHDHVVFPHFDF
jgi:hypothetical protein